MIAASIAIALVAAAAPLLIHACATGRIPVNLFAGIRIRSVMSSAPAWRAGHRAALPATWIGAIPSFALAAVSFSPALPKGAQSGFVTAAVIVLVAAVVVGGVFANRAALNELAKHEEQHR